MASNVQRAQSEETAEYLVFPLIPSEVKDEEVVKYLEGQLDAFLAHISAYVVDYIWQNEPFNLRVFPPTGSTPGHIGGTTNYGDNVEDEWFIVFLLQQLTKDFHGLLAKISDNDGEFLLIEAAMTIPKWLDPETADNRIFFFGGKLHIIPKSQTPGTPTLQEATTCIRGNPQATRASDKVQKDIQRRMAGYPEKKHEFVHHTHCYIPAPLAAVLDSAPHLVAPMVQAFYYRDPVDLRACITFKYFPPGTRVTRQVRFTKCLYAQLMQQRFQPDKRCGYTMPATSNPKFKSHDLGMKLAHGAEILCSRCGPPRKKDQSLEEISKKDVRWSRFVESLADKGYFRGELEGSKLYIKLLDDARVFFYNTVSTSSKSVPSTGQAILRTLQSANYDIEEMRKEEKNLRPEDDDSWLNLSPEELDDMLKKAMGDHPTNASSGDSFNLDKMAESMKGFVNKVSSYEGAEFPKHDDSDIQLDSNSFVQTMQKMFEFDDDEGSSSDMDEYASDDDLADSLSPNSPSKKPLSGKSAETSLKEYMDMMDRELASTTIGQSFKTKSIPEEPEPPQPKPPPRKKKQERMAKAAANGDANTPAAASAAPAATKTKKTKKKSKKSKAPKAAADDIDDLDDDDFKPVNVDLNLVENLLESYKSQQGTAGPTSNIMGSMGMRIPQDESKK